MFPTLCPGDEIIVLKPGRFQVGDVIGYHIGNKTSLHRIVKIKKERIYTKGDNNLKIDPYTITLDNIIGKLVKIRRNNKVYNIRNKFPGYLTGKKCFIMKSLKKSLYVLLKYICRLKPILWGFNKIGQTVFYKRLSIVKLTNNRYMVCCSRQCCGCYDSYNKEWVLRNRFKLLFSDTQLQNIIKRIDMQKD
jgi:hypothetical protein